jgi:hypothetical protein
MNQQNTSLKQLFSNISNSSKDPFQKDLWIGWYFSFVCLVVSVIGLILDDRILQYVPIWLKPFKFSVSSLIFIGSILYFLKYIPNKKFILLTNKIVSYGLIIELIIIFLQAYRGKMSHFNNQTFEDMILFQIMAITIVCVWLGFGVYAWKLFKASEYMDELIFKGIQVGAVITFLTMPFAFTMPQPSKIQIQEIIKNKSQIGLIVGSHTVDEKDPSQTYPLTGWAKTGGDLRIAHFLGLHALQILPILAFLLNGMNFTISNKKWILRTTGLFYLLLVVVVLAQALKGVPILRFLFNEV